MKKLLGILVLGLLAGCATISEYETSSARGGTLSSHFLSGESQSQLMRRANMQCRQYYSNSKVVDFKQTYQGGFMKSLSPGEYSTYTYRCQTEIEQTQKKQVQLASMIDKAKDTCKSLGFTEGTEKFSDCSLKLYSQSVELAVKNNQQVVMQPQSSGSNVMTIYDPRRDSRILINQGQRMLSGACTLGINC